MPVRNRHSARFGAKLIPCILLADANPGKTTMSRVAQILSAFLLFISGTLMVFYMAQAQPRPLHLLHADDPFLDGSTPAATGYFSQPRMRSVSTIGSR